MAAAGDGCRFCFDMEIGLLKSLLTAKSPQGIAKGAKNLS